MDEVRRFIARHYIHYDPERIDYSVTKDQLERLEEGTHNLWKDICLVSISLAIPLLINAIVETYKQPSFNLTTSIFLNYLIGVVSSALAAISGAFWFSTRHRFYSIVNNIRQQPRMRIEVYPDHIEAFEPGGDIIEGPPSEENPN